jgi:hypothetical protein
MCLWGRGSSWFIGLRKQLNARKVQRCRQHAAPQVGELRMLPDMVSAAKSLPAFSVHGPSAQKQVFTPFSVEQPLLRLGLNPSRSLLPFKLNSHLRSSLEANVILR